MSESTEIATLNPVLPLVTAEQARDGWAKFEALKAALLTEDDYQKISGKAFIKRSGFRKIAVYFGLSDSILEEERKDREDGSFTWRIMVEARAPNGRTSVGVAICDSTERKFSHLEHDTYSTAHTRAKSRAISDLVGGGAVSAEEMEATQPEERSPEATLTPSITEALQSAGVDPRKVEIRREGGKTYIYATSSLEDWVPAKIALSVIGYEWNPQAGRWEARVR